MNQRRLMELKRMKYEDYLQTPEWKAKREEILDRDEHRCRLCNTTEKLRVHHRTYIRLGDEDPNDLTTLCDDCHKNFHQQMKLADHMSSERRYMPLREEKSEEQRQRDDQLAWEDYLNGLLLQNIGFCLHVCGIISQEDFVGEDTKVLYSLLTTASQAKQPFTEHLIPTDLQETVNRAKRRAESKTPKDESVLVKEVLGVSRRIKRITLLRKNTELKQQAQEAAEANNKPLAKQYWQEMSLLQRQIRVLDASTHLQG